MSHPEKLTPRELGVDTAPYRGHAAVATTVGDLGRVLQLTRPVIRRTFPDDIYDRIDRIVAERIAEWDAPFVSRMVNERWRITLAVYGPRATAFWPVLGKTPAQVLADCRERRANLHWSAPLSRKEDLRQAETALERIINEEEGE